MLDFFYKGVTPWAVADKKQIYINRVLGRIANYTYPVYCNFNKIKLNSNYASKICHHKVIVSLTSFPARIDKVYLCINSLLRQSFKADKVILWLADTQFPDGTGVPRNLLDLVGKDFEIRYCKDLRSYKKVFYTAQEFKEDIIITVDDDTLYPESWLLDLIKTYIKYPNCVCCYRAHKMVLNGEVITPYSDWIGLSPDEMGPDMLLVPIGVGGVLYPPKYFDNVDFDYCLELERLILRRRVLLMSMVWRIKKLIQDYRYRKVDIGDNSRINLGVQISNPQNMKIGDNTYINGGVFSISENSKICIGNDCLISYNVHFRTVSHYYENKNELIRNQGEFEKDIIIEDDVWVGYGAQIMPGVTVHRGAVIGAGAVVTRDVLPYTVVGGCQPKLSKLANSTFNYCSSI